MGYIGYFYNFISTFSIWFELNERGRRLDTGSSSGVSFSMSFFFEVACFDLEALAENRRTKSSSSFIFASDFLFFSSSCRLDNSSILSRNYSFLGRFLRLQNPRLRYVCILCLRNDDREIPQ